MTCRRFVAECSSLPCQNGGSCDDLHGGYRCLCDRGYAGYQVVKADVILITILMNVHFLQVNSYIIYICI